MDIINLFIRNNVLYLRRETMIYTRKPYQIDSVYYEENTLKIGCECQEYTEALTGGKATFKSAKGRITVTVFSPANDVITIKATNHQTEPRSKGTATVKLDPTTAGSLEDKGDYLAFKSGHLEARINKTTFSIKYFYCDKELCKQSVNMPIFYKTDSGSENFCTVSSNARSGASFDLEARELVYGLGCAGASVVRNGQKIKCNDFENRSNTSFIPFVLSDSKYGLFINTNRPVTVSVGSDSGRITFEAEDEEIEYSVIAGDTSIGILELFSQLNGRTPVLPYSDGGISIALNDNYSLTAQEILDALRNAYNSGIHVSEIWLGNSWHPDYAPYGFTWDTVRFPDPSGFVRQAAELGVKIGISVNPFISERAPEYSELLDIGYFISFPDGRTVLCDADKGGVALLDLNKPEARSWLINACSTLARDGFNIFESNFTHSISDIFEQASGKKNYLMNYSSFLNSALSDISERERGRLGSLVIADTICSGDQDSPFSSIYSKLPPEYPDLSSAVKSAISYGLTGFGGINIDIPEKSITDPGLFERWIAFATYTPHVRFCGTLKLLEDTALINSLKSFCAIRNVLAPYVYSCLCENTNYGTPVIRALPLEFAGDPAGASFDTEYLLGNSLLIAPVITANETMRVYLPAGIWTDFMTHEKIQGPRYISRKSNPSAMPVYARPNSIIPTRTPDSTAGIGSLDNLTFTCFGLSAGNTAACEVFADGGQGSGIITAEYEGNKIIVRTKNLGGTKHLVLSGILNVVGLSESVPEKLSYGTTIEFTSNELVITLG